MIVFCNYSCIKDKEDVIETYNLLSLKDMGIRLDQLIPPFRKEIYDDEKQFDLAYADYILRDDMAFVQFMTLVYTQYESSIDNIVVVLVDRDEYRDSITESLIKLIQQRYGINPHLINSIEDWDDLEVSDADNFHVPGLYNFDIDKERYVNLITDTDELAKELGNVVQQSI